ncbi:MAG TPA: hypothetical protein VF041_08425 [Gemmatimonadaceae bacterium]
MASAPRSHPRQPLEAPATGSSGVERTELAPEEEPSTPGTLFLCVILLMIVAGFWVIIYLELLHR